MRTPFSMKYLRALSTLILALWFYSLSAQIGVDQVGRSAVAGSASFQESIAKMPFITQKDPDCLSCCSFDQVLPVEMTYFRGERKGDIALLEWGTAMEINNEGFFIERSPDAVSWTTRGFVPGQGTTREAQHYQWPDRTPLSGPNYYRLRQVDHDGQYAYSHIVLVQFQVRVRWQVFPNPAGASLSYTFPNHQAIEQVQLLDLHGRLLRESTDINGRFSLAGLPQGVYLLVIQTPAGYYQSRVVKK